MVQAAFGIKGSPGGLAIRELEKTGAIHLGVQRFIQVDVRPADIRRAERALAAPVQGEYAGRKPRNLLINRDVVQTEKA